MSRKTTKSREVAPHRHSAEGAGFRTARGHLALLSRLPQASAAWLLQVSTRTLRDAVDAPRLADGRYDLRTLLAWWLDRERKKLPTGLPAERKRILNAQASALERRNAIDAGKLVAVEDVGVLIETVFGALRTEFEAIERAHGTAVGDWIRQAIGRAEAAARDRITKIGGVEGNTDRLGLVAQPG